VTLRVPSVDEQGHVVMTEHSLNRAHPQRRAGGAGAATRGQGSPGIGEGKPGDLYLEIHFEPHPRFRVEGRDVDATLRVAPWEAALGATVKASLPVGAVEVRVPEGSQNGRKLRLKGRGIPAATPGDLYLVLEIVLPPANSPKAREALSSNGA
jgi:curved DNA-binding protein